MATGRIFSKLAALSVAFVMATSSCINDDEPGREQIVKTGDRIPSFSVTMNDGRTVTPADLAGAPSVIVFFTTRCGDCRRLLPVIQEVHEQRPDLNLVCISREEDETMVNRYWADNSLTLPYSAQTDRTVYNLFANGGVPQTYVVNSDLIVIATFDDRQTPTADQLIELCYSR